jgi:hypothetical protein
MILELLAAALLMGGDDNHCDNSFDHHPRKSSGFGFEEADSFFDRDGNEHIVDDDGYCEDCDDYHDDY